MKLHAISGLPRSGSTLLTNILNQNPKFFASSTSPALAAANGPLPFTNSLEYKMELQETPMVSAAPLEMFKSCLEIWYNKLQEGGRFSDEVTHIFDKNRGWTHNARKLLITFPNSVNIVCVRDPKDVIASIIKQDNKDPFTDIDGNTFQMIGNKIQKEMSNEGRVGSCIMGIADCIQRKIPNVFFLKYEVFIKNPKEALDTLYEFMKEEPFEHDFENIDKSCYEMDAFYLNKFPHNGIGPIKEPKKDQWTQFFTPDIAENINASYPRFMKHFGYSE